MAPDHLNAFGLTIVVVDGKGRGVYATRPIPAHIVIEISPVLLFNKDEYHAHGRHTVLEHYTFIWRNGTMALALGLGSLFNHADPPNVSYTLDHATESIRYTTTRAIDVGEELCIFYGHKLWFVPHGEPAIASNEVEQDFWDLHAEEAIREDVALENEPRVAGHDQGHVVDEESLPFTRLRITADDEEDEASVQTFEVWVVDIPDPRHTSGLLKWCRAAGLETPEVTHLKRIRRDPASSITTLLLCPASSPPPVLPTLDPPLSTPFNVRVPLIAARTLSSAKLKNRLWPTVYTPRRKGEIEPWTLGKVRWARQAMQRAIVAAEMASQSGELPIASFVPLTYEGDTQATSEEEEFVAHDTRTTTAHPLRHAVQNILRRIGDSHANASPRAAVLYTAKSEHEAGTTNGMNYLLTNRTLFTTHEPCIMCAMALTHSRVKEIFYLFPMQATGGCGGAACVPQLKGVNHRFGISRWTLSEATFECLDINDNLDA